MNQGLITLGSATNFAEFVDNVYMPVSYQDGQAAPRTDTEGIIKNYLKPQFGKLCLRDI